MDKPCEGGPCPKCGRVVCHVKEDPYIVFCSNTLCDFHDEYKPFWLRPIMQRFKELLKYPPLFLKRNEYRKDYLYSQYKNPFLSKEDIEDGKYIVREFELDKERYNKWHPKGMPIENCYRIDSPIIAKYASLELLVKDGWFCEENPVIDKYLITY